jgi:small-conductance mechanosensitive channel
MPRIILVLGLATTAAALWWFRSISADYQLFAGVTFTWCLDMAASVATALLFVLLVGHGVVQLLLVTVGGVGPNGFHRASIYGILAIVAAAAALTHLGVNVTAVFATSAVLTAILGFALQPSLGGLIGGLTLHTDRVLRIGDAILQNGDFVEVTAFNWRSVSGRKLDGTTVVFPNARIVDSAIEILPGDRPVRAETVFAAPITMAPQCLSDLVGEVVADFAEVDDDQPIIVAPISFDPERATARYRVRYWVHAYADRSDLDGEVLRGVWYALQREGVPWPLSILYDTALRSPLVPAGLTTHDWPEMIVAAMAHAPPNPDFDAIFACSAQEIARVGIPLGYLASERIIFPSRVRGHLCLLVQGAVYEIASEFDTLPRPRRFSESAGSSHDAEWLSRRAQIKRISDRLADAIGPYAEIAVQQAAGHSAGLAEISGSVAHEIADPALRRAFLAETVVPEERRHGPGLMFRIVGDAVGRSTPDTLLRAVDACTFVAIPPSLLTSIASAAGQH